MAFDVDNWLSELQKAGNLSPEVTASMKTALGNPEVVKVLEGNQLRQSDYSRAMNELATKEQAAVKLQGELVAWRNDAEAKLKAAGLTVAQERQERAKIEVALKTAAETYNLDLTSLGLPAPDQTKPAPAKETPTNPDYMLKKDWETEAASIRGKFPFLPALIHDLSVEHQALFGKPLADSQGLVRKALETGKDIKTVWEEENKVAERRTQITEEAVTARINTAVQKREAELRSELQLPPTPRADSRSPVLADYKPPSDQESNKQESVVDRAVSAWQEHKYRVPQGQTA